ncbi:hypothetical protein [Tenacibaculum sp. M341]|uniref:hypothetical protein n=1 Tax=Tenacibaculum sp. M341 TaxID=2530339 RepID=UPI00104F4CDE|nr:hypothetical protein [Tenacibaculum sp. M341]TCI94856.1 hypothetical protein EYW44_00610 [Tenacibaculum sp. M341]
MKKIFVTVLMVSAFMVSCGDKKAEEQKKKEVELEQQIESVDKEVNQDVESLEKDAKEIENALDELDNL